MWKAETVQVVFHKGAKVKDNSGEGMEISDPARLLKWVARERAIVTFSGPEDIQSKEAALTGIVRQWIAQM
jgi:hypothetical protein